VKYKKIDLAGHSLGARVVSAVARTYGNIEGSPRLATCALYGAAERKQDFSKMLARRPGKRPTKLIHVFCGNDFALQVLFRAAKLSKPIGLAEVISRISSFHQMDASGEGNMGGLNHDYSKLPATFYTV